MRTTKTNLFKTFLPAILLALCISFGNNSKLWGQNIIEISAGGVDNYTNAAYTNYSSYMHIWNYSPGGPNATKIFYTPNEMQQAISGATGSISVPCIIEDIALSIHGIYTSYSDQNPIENASIWIRNVPQAEIDTDYITSTGYKYAAPNTPVDTSYINGWRKIYDNPKLLTSRGGDYDHPGNDNFPNNPNPGDANPIDAQGIWYRFAEKYCKVPERTTDPFIYAGGYIEVLFMRKGPSITGSVNCFIARLEGPAVYGGTALYRMLQATNGVTYTSYPNQMRYKVRFYATPVAMEYVGTDISSVSNPVISDSKYKIAQINIKTKNDRTPLSLSSLDINYAGTTASTTVTKVYLYSTGSSNAFSTGTLVGSIDGPIDLSQSFTVNFDNHTLLTGNNYFWLAYDIDPSQTNCNNVLSAGVNSITISDETGYYDINKNLSNAVELVYDPINISNAQTEYTICTSNETTDIQLNATGTIKGYKWEQRVPDTDNYIDMDNSTNHASISTSDVLSGKDVYRISVYAPDGGCTENEEYTIHITPVDTIKSVTAFVAGNDDIEETIELCEGQELTITSEIINAKGDVASSSDYQTVQWQYERPDGGWEDISLFEMPTATSTTLNFVAAPHFGNTKLRMIVYNNDPCYTPTASNNEIPIKVFKNPSFDKQPPKTVSLCPGEDFYVALIYYGEEPTERGWWKDGQKLIKLDDDGFNIYEKEELEFDSVGYDLAGKYYYVIKTEICNGDTIVVSDTVSFAVLPETEVINITKGNVRANPGTVAKLEVTATYAGLTPDYYKDSFQWYRYNVLTNSSIKLENSNRIKGADASVLIISFVNQGDYTYNNDYYYCVVNGRCGQSATSAPIYLIEDANVAITQQPTDVTVCNDQPTTALSLNAFTSESKPIMYQWYYDNNKLSDNTIYQGTTSDILTISIDPSSAFTSTFYCNVWLDNEASAKKSNEVTVTVLDNTPVVINSISPSQVSVEAGSKLELFVETDNPNDVISWYKDGKNTNVTGGIYLLSTAAASDAGVYSLSIWNGCEDFIPTQTMTVTVTSKNPTTGISENISKYGLDLTPNPSSDHLTVSYRSDIETNTTIDIFDVRGLCLYSFHSASISGLNSYEIDLSKLLLSSGNYFIRLNHANAIGKYYMKSFVVTK